MKSLVSLTLVLSMIAGAAIIGSPEASANPRIKNRVNKRQFRQQTRISKGVANGSLTKRETMGLQMQQQKLAKQEQRMRASGDGLTAKEKVQLEKRQDNLSDNIYDQKHDAQSR